MVDFLALFLEGMLLYAIASLIPLKTHFAVALAILLVVDIVWGYLTLTYCINACIGLRDLKRQAIAFTGVWRRGTEYPDQPQTAWMLNNLLWLVALVVLLATVATTNLTMLTNWGVMLLAVIRTISDYRVSWAFYFPE